MERGLIWLPLLGIFIWLVWAGWNEYEKVQAYQAWAANFERHKYDIYAVLGQKGDRLTWGKPTRRGLVDERTVSFSDLVEVLLQIDGQSWAEVAEDLPPTARKVSIDLISKSGDRYSIPFTEVQIAADWFRYLKNKIGDR